MDDSINFNDGVLKFPKIDKGDPAWDEYIHFDVGRNCIDFGKPDMVNSPAHYTGGKQEAIETIEEAIEEAPNMKAAYLQGQVLKYLLRIWLKGNPREDAEKARWYLNRLINSL